MNNNTDGSNAVFNDLADSYDAGFTETEIGKLLRARTHHQMAGLFPPGSQVLEINCGTGEDALFLASSGVNVLATDISEKMVSNAREKAEISGLDEFINLHVCRFESLESVLCENQVFDGVVSNFGGVNCAGDISTLAEKLAARVKPGGFLFICIMGRVVPWEWVLLGLRGNFKRIRDRLSGKCRWRGQNIRYYSPGHVIKAFRPYCRVVRVSGLGFLLPPTYAGDLVARKPGIFRALNSMEVRVQSFPLIPHLSDHFMLILCRT